MQRPSRCFARRFELQGTKVVVHLSYISVNADLRALLDGLALTLSGETVGSKDPAPSSRTVAVARPFLAPPSPPVAVSGPLASDGMGPEPSRGLASLATRLEQLEALVSGPGTFARHPDNARLLPITLSYATPFRGTLFGEPTLRGVAAALQDRRVDVLILGSNPSAGELSADSPHGSLDEQFHSGLFGEAYFDAARRPRAGWAPQTDRKPGWQSLFRSIQGAGYRGDTVTMANYLPWGSSQLHEFLNTLDAALLQRVIEFADLQLLRMLALLRPKLVIAVRSLSQTAGLEASVPARWSAQAVPASVEVPTVAGGIKRVHLLKTPALHTWGCRSFTCPTPATCACRDKRLPCSSRRWPD